MDKIKKILNNDIVEKNITNTNIPETLVKEETI